MRGITKSLLFIMLMCLCCCQSRKYTSPQLIKVRDIITGNTIVLSNGVHVVLLGVGATQESKAELEKYRDMVVRVRPDSSSLFDVLALRRQSKVYAYVSIPALHCCINTKLLKDGKTSLLETPFLVDSLAYYRQIVNRDAVVTPEDTPVIDYDEDDIHLPEYTLSGERRFSSWSCGPEDTKLLDEACDYNSPYTKYFANQLAMKSAGTFNIGQVCEIYDYCYGNWSYVNDPVDGEYAAKASESIYFSLSGDCDDFAILIASCIAAIGGRPSISLAFDGNSGHAYAEVDIAPLGKDNVISFLKERYAAYNPSLYLRQDGENLWLNMDWMAPYPGGKYWGNERYTYTLWGNGWKFMSHTKN